MRNILSILVLIGITFMACKKEDITADLHFDGDNFDAPILEAGNHITAARFPGSQTEEFNGKTIEEVIFYLVNLPDKAEVRIYGQGTDTTAGDLLYSADIASMEANEWNRHTLSNPVDITGDDLWIAIYVELSANTASVGCDPGPANVNGDWIFTDGVHDWISLRERTGETNINWNIRGIVSE